jgi:hypothetical protein
MESSKLPLKAFVDLEWLPDLVYDHRCDVNLLSLHLHPSASSVLHCITEVYLEISATKRSKMVHDAKIVNGHIKTNITFAASFYLFSVQHVRRSANKASHA